jgi:hypothetical protein
MVRFVEGQRDRVIERCREKGFTIVEEIPGVNTLVCSKEVSFRARAEIAALDRWVAPLQEDKTLTEAVEAVYTVYLPTPPRLKPPAEALRAAVASARPAARPSDSLFTPARALQARPAHPDDEFFQSGLLWGLDLIGATNPPPLRDVPLVAVVDTGIDYEHPDLTKSIYLDPQPEPGGTRRGARFFGEPSRPVERNGDPMDDYGHGTHLAGIIAATGDNQMGVLGVASNANLMAIKVFNGLPRPSSDTRIVNAGVSYACRRKAKIVNLSFELRPGRNGDLSEYDTLQLTMERTFPQVLFVAAAGNGDVNGVGLDLDLPANKVFPASFRLKSGNLITVAAVDRNGQLSDFSNYGRTTVDVAAPGGSRDGRGYDILSTNLWKNQPDTSKYYLWLPGTSMAAAYVSGVAAAIWAREPNLIAREVRERIIATARPIQYSLGDARRIAGGVVRLDRALHAGAPTSAPAPAAPPPVAIPVDPAPAAPAPAGANPDDAPRIPIPPAPPQNPGHGGPYAEDAADAPEQDGPTTPTLQPGPPTNSGRRVPGDTCPGQPSRFTPEPQPPPRPAAAPPDSSARVSLPTPP